MASASAIIRLTAEERRTDLWRLLKELSQEKQDCVSCVRGARCREPHAKPYKTLAWCFSVREGTIIADIEATRAEMRDRRLTGAQEHEEQVLRNLVWVEAEAMAEWERSKLPFTQTTTESSTSGAGIESGATTMRDRRTRAQKILREQTGEVAYLSTVLAVQLQRRAIWGLDAPKRIIPLNPDGTGVFEWMRDIAQDALRNVIDVTPMRIAPIRQIEYDLPEVEDVALDAPS